MLQRLLGAVTKRIPRHALSQLEEKALGLRPFERLALPMPSSFTVSCDDGELRDLDIVEVLDKVGAKGVFGISPALVGRPGFLSFEQIRQIARAGHEIAFHGTTHDPFTGYASPQALQAACDEGVAWLAREGLGQASTLIYPYGSHNRKVRASMAQTFQCAFTTWMGLNEGHTNRFAIRRVPFGAYTGRLPASEDWYRGLLSRCAAQGSWAALMLHPAAAEHTPAHTALLERLLRQAQDLGLKTRTAAAHFGAAPPALLDTVA
jgi:peptidoglycan/xylan/chitin deacetylase (PgdA/CDA1 family)